MAYLNTSIPPIHCKVRGEYLNNLEDNYGSYEDCIIFGVASIPSQATLFHIIMKDGALYWRLPISAFCWKTTAPLQELKDLQLYDNFSYYISIHSYSYIKHNRVNYKSKRSGEVYEGQYLFTLDWGWGDESITDVGVSEIPYEHKCGHVIKLDNGNFAIQPNNRIRFFDPSFTDEREFIDRKINSHLWSVE